MNYFGLFFTFMIPGILLGIMAGAVVRESMQSRRRHAARARQAAPAHAARNAKLFVYDLYHDVAPSGVHKACRDGSEQSAA